jgi:Zn-dependent peptidase ImmA (M78 family)
MPSETLRIAELQANRLLGRFGIDQPPVAEEIISELPRIEVVREPGLPVSGCAHWNGRHWVIALSADEPPARQKFSAAHEFKHVLDHTTGIFLYRDTPYQSAAAQAERVADYFAACLLMPKRLVKRLWFEGPQSVERLADSFEVSPAAVRYRVSQLGLIDAASRCDRSTVLARPHGRRYLRRSPVRRAVAVGTGGRQ